MDAAVEELRGRLDVPVLSQRDRPKPALVAEFAADREACLFATLGFWQGVDVPGPTLSLVTIDRLPFPRPDEPLLQARREVHRQDAFRRVDLPRAATLLAQGAGRLVRRASDRGVVAVLDATPGDQPQLPVGPHRCAASHAPHPRSLGDRAVPPRPSGRSVDRGAAARTVARARLVRPTGRLF